VPEYKKKEYVIRFFICFYLGIHFNGAALTETKTEVLFA
jgi:hypothetical protein